MAPKKYSKKSQSKGDIETPEEKQQQNRNDLFPVVGIGASAGGLEAFMQLLNHLPINTGMAFVMIQHMLPTHESLLSAILGRSTQMQVHEVTDGMAVAPNQVYVIPPNVSMSIDRGILSLRPRGTGRGVFMSVDTFLLSLAEERGNKAIGVILSGGDGDGARGLEAIKAAGGITFAQCEDSAQVSSMPNTAVATGQVDFILTPEKIAKKIAEIALHPYIADRASTQSATQEDTIETKDAIAAIYSLLHTATGVDFTNYKQTTLKRRMQRRMLLYKLDRIEDYAKYLQNTPAEVTALYHDVFIHVTSFFRDPESFKALSSKVFPAIVKDKPPQTPIRIWIAGCATGEEAYSIAICLLEFLADRATNLPIQIYATDISETAIVHARKGFYTSGQVADVSPERLHRFFVRVDGGYQIATPVRELCVFARQNLISDPPFSRMDLITCRNVLIYLGAPLQKKLLPMFHYGLGPAGFLMLGTSETVGDFAELFALFDKKHKIYAKKQQSHWLGIDLTTSSYPAIAINTLPVQTEKLDEIEIEKEADRIVLNHYAPVGVIINTASEILQFRGQTNAYLEPAPGRASLNLLRMAKEGLRLELRAAIQQANQQQLPVERTGLQIREGESLRQVKINVIPFPAGAASKDYFLVLFQDEQQIPAMATAADDGRVNSGAKTDESLEIARLQQELKTTKEHLGAIVQEHQAANQDLRAANEEILSSNEELQSMNEELETAKEEIQATNEELNTINDELQRRNVESTKVSNDLQNLLGSINIPILMLGGDLRVRRFTPAVEGIFNLISSDIGRSLSDITHKLIVPDLEQQILEVIRTLNLNVQEVQDRDGHWYDLQIRPYRTIDNKIDGAVLVLVDINELKQSAQQLMEAKTYAETIVETVREPLLVLDLNLRAITANHAFYQTFQVMPVQTEQRSIFDLGNGQWNIPKLRSILEAILAGNAEFQDFEVEHEFEQIGHRIMVLSARKMPPIGDTQMILLAIEDITEQKRLETQRSLLMQEQSARAAAESANRAKDEFLSVLSHELRTPLNAMIGWAQLLQMKTFDETRIEEGLKTIERSAKAQNQLIEDILDVSRITTGKFRLNPYLIELNPLVENAIEVVNLAAQAKNIQLKSSLTPLTPKVLGDPSRLQQALWNLLSNAIKFTPAGGRVDIELDCIDGMAQIQIRDTGKGIHPDFLPHVFERFRQADSSYTRTDSGLGLGLSIVHHLVELHGGTVDAESSGEGQGATFTVKLPVRTDIEGSSTQRILEALDAAKWPALPAEIPSLAGVRVLIVDDELDMRQLFTTILEQYEVEAGAAASATEALSMLTANPEKYDVLLFDIGMPEQDGYSLIRQVRRLSAEAGGQIPAAALTAYARDDDRLEAIAAGFQIHVAKPIESVQLAAIVAALAGRV
ncbi:MULTISPECIES: chemotaxis protein CheB [unclassified Microcoleus]|uniref:chemotaxis protein CheB n=1 Tax=unclassified Microcoleus TaxID=2642155 RepID=UPI0025DCF1A4|nr:MULTISPECIES: chemotaxis protein CheB [unclassified Microcoleus]